MIQFLNFGQLFLYYCVKPYNQMKFFKLVVILLTVVNLACERSPNPEDISNALQRGIVTAEIIHPAGEYPQIFFNLTSEKFEQVEKINGLPAPFNIGQLKFIQETNERFVYALIIGAAIPKNTQLDIKTIGMIRFLDEVEIPLIVGIPAEKEMIAPSIRDFQTLLFENDPTKRMIEQWLTYHQFPFPFTSFFWEDEKATNNWLSKHPISN